MKPIFKTIAERFGFIDNDIATPEHDRILIWLHEHIQHVVNEQLYPSNPEWTDTEIRKAELLRAKAAQTWPWVDLGPLPPKRQPSVGEPVWQEPISEGRLIVGFVDMRVNVELHDQICLNSSGSIISDSVIFSLERSERVKRSALLVSRRLRLPDIVRSDATNAITR